MRKCVSAKSAPNTPTPPSVWYPWVRWPAWGMGWLRLFPDSTACDLGWFGWCCHKLWCYSSMVVAWMQRHATVLVHACWTQEVEMILKFSCPLVSLVDSPPLATTPWINLSVHDNHTRIKDCWRWGQCHLDHRWVCWHTHTHDHSTKEQGPETGTQRDAGCWSFLLHWSKNVGQHSHLVVWPTAVCWYLVDWRNMADLRSLVVLLLLVVTGIRAEGKVPQDVKGCTHVDPCRSTRHIPTSSCRFATNVCWNIESMYPCVRCNRFFQCPILGLERQVRYARNFSVHFCWLYSPKGVVDIQEDSEAAVCGCVGWWGSQCRRGGGGPVFIFSVVFIRGGPVCRRRPCRRVAPMQKHGSTLCWFCEACNQTHL